LSTSGIASFDDLLRLISPDYKKSIGMQKPVSPSKWLCGSRYQYAARQTRDCFRALKRAVFVTSAPCKAPAAIGQLVLGVAGRVFSESADARTVVGSVRAGSCSQDSLTGCVATRKIPETPCSSMQLDEADCMPDWFPQTPSTQDLHLLYTAA
jgi:hypothetical protein